MKAILKIALNDQTSFKTSKMLIFASKNLARSYFEELESFHSKGNTRLKEDGLEFFILDLVVNFKEQQVSFPTNALISLLKADQDIYYFVQKLINGSTTFVDSWINTSTDKRVAIQSAHKVARNFQRHQIDNQFNPLYVYTPKISKKIMN
jgi:hypothetical protein